MNFLKQKKFLAILVVAVIILFGIGGGYVYFTKASQSASTDTTQDTPSIPSLSPDDIGLTITLRDDKNAMQFALSKASDISGVEYTISYTAEVKGQTVNQGLFGEITNPDGKSTIGTDTFREFGTCSSGVCRYDNVTSPIKLTLKITKTDGKIYQVEKSFNR